MKLKKFNQIFEAQNDWTLGKIGFDRQEWFQDEDDEYKGDDEDESEEDDMSHLCYLLRSMFSNSNIDVEVSNKGLDLFITAQFARRESLSDIVKVFEVVKKIKKDILAQYSSAYEIWETKKGTPMITFQFMLEDDEDGDGVVTNDKDDYPW